jgi:hypothetical protein
MSSFCTPLGVVVWHPCVTDVIHLANVLYLCSYLVRDILWLRVLSILAGLCLMPYYCSCGSHPLWAPISWNAVFTAVNCAQVIVLIGERRSRSMPGSQRRLHETIFPDLTPGEFRQLVGIGSWRDVAEGTRLIAEGSEVGEMMLLDAGGIEIRAAGRTIARLRPGQFIGEMSFLSGSCASADVVAMEPSRVLAWPQDRLGRLLETRPSIALKLRGVLGRDVVAKLRAQGMADGIHS